MKEKLSTDLAGIRNKVEDQVSEMTKLSERCEKNLGVVVERKESVKDMLNTLFERWKILLLNRRSLMLQFPRDLNKSNSRTRNFTLFFFLRPGVLKLLLFNLTVFILVWVVRIICAALILGLVGLAFYALMELIDMIGDLIQSDDPADVSKSL